MAHYNSNAFGPTNPVYSQLPSAQNYADILQETIAHSPFYNYKQKLDAYMRHRNAIRQKMKSTTSVTNANVRLSDVKTDLQRAFCIINAVKEETQKLNLTASDLSEEEWSTKINEITQKQLEIQLLTQKYKCPIFQQAIQNQSLKRASKRLKIKKQKAIIRKYNQQTMLRRKAKKAEIEKWLSHQQQQNSERRRKEEDSKYAEEILDGIIKKRMEAMQYIKLMDSLIELRHARSIQSGQSDTGQSEFIAKIERLKNIWLDAKVNYEAEENELQNYMNPNGSLENDWCNALFGCNKSVLSQQANSFKEILRIRFVLML